METMGPQLPSSGLETETPYFHRCSRSICTGIYTLFYDSSSRLHRKATPPSKLKLWICSLREDTLRHWLQKYASEVLCVAFGVLFLSAFRMFLHAYRKISGEMPLAR